MTRTHGVTTLDDQAPLRRLAAILHAARSFGSRLWHGAPDTVHELLPDLQSLFRLLQARKIEYVLVGGVALLRYIEGRNTEDIDLIPAIDSLDRVPELKIEERTADTARARFGPLQVDLLFASDAVSRLAHDHHRTTHRFAEIEVRCATVDGLIVLKLYALPALYRQQDLARAALYETDVLMLAQRHHADLPKLLAALRPFVAPGEYEELQRIVSEIEQRIKRMRGEAGA